MPLYEYTCQDCGCKFDTLRAIKNADATIECQHCHSTNTHRKISSFFAKSEGRTLTTSSNCGSCSGGSCSCCGH